MSNKIFLSVDGGGTKLRMLLFDEDFKILGEGYSGGINLSSTTETDARANIQQCLEETFSEFKPKVLDKLYCIFVGDITFLFEAIKPFCRVNEIIPLSEAEGGLLAGALWRSGFLAQLGTGSFVSFVPGNSCFKQIENSHSYRSCCVGGWGPILGDDGSGAWIGYQAIRRAITGQEGWSDPSVIIHLIRRDWGLEHDWDMVDIVYRSPAPFRKLASLTGIVAEAADTGDKVARDILIEAGHLMAVQAECLIKRCFFPAEDFRLCCSGGAWKTHPLIFDTFSNELLNACPNLIIRRNRFEQVLAGPVMEVLENSRIGTPADAEEFLAKLFPSYELNWY